MAKSGDKHIGFFARYLTLWVGLCIVAGVLIGQFMPAVPGFLKTMEYANVSIPVAIDRKSTRLNSSHH